MITFEHVDEGILEVFVDDEGKEILLSLLHNLKSPGDHEHLMTPAWSGHGLSEEANNPVGKVIQMVTIGMPKQKRTLPEE
ncbi:MAG: immunity protein 32 [Akkermansiaceae bacterium]|nr:immunity protein 32 [Armatimonadota bacterium]